MKSKNFRLLRIDLDENPFTNTYLFKIFILVNCVTPYVLTSSGTCANTLLDINNCGSLGHNCSALNYTSCSAGTCSNAPGILLSNPSFVWTAGLNGSVDDNYYSLRLPMNITLYSTTTDTIYVTTNGVSFATAYLQN